MFKKDGIRYELSVLMLWLVAVVPTYLLFRNASSFTFLAPLYFLCMLGSVLIVRQARRKDR